MNLSELTSNCVCTYISESCLRQCQRRLEDYETYCNTKITEENHQKDAAKKSDLNETQEESVLKVHSYCSVATENTETLNDYDKMRYITAVLLSKMDSRDKAIIGFEDLLALFESYSFGFKRLHEELNNQGRIPTLKLISSMENVVAHQSKENLKEFLSAYDFFSERKPGILESVLRMSNVEKFFLLLFSYFFIFSFLHLLTNCSSN